MEVSGMIPSFAVVVADSAMVRASADPSSFCSGCEGTGFRRRSVAVLPPTSSTLTLFTVTSSVTFCVELFAAASIAGNTALAIGKESRFTLLVASLACFVLPCSRFSAVAARSVSVARSVVFARCASSSCRMSSSRLFPGACDADVTDPLATALGGTVETLETAATGAMVLLKRVPVAWPQQHRKPRLPSFLASVIAPFIPGQA
jgi:hypothetical protein